MLVLISGKGSATSVEGNNSFHLLCASSECCFHQQHYLNVCITALPLFHFLQCHTGPEGWE